jgi:hypothetical protein
MREGGKKAEVKKVISLRYSLFKNEYRIFKPVEINVRRELR